MLIKCFILKDRESAISHKQDSIIFVMLRKKNCPDLAFKTLNYWTSEARWQNKVSFGFKIYHLLSKIYVIYEKGDGL